MAEKELSAGGISRGEEDEVDDPTSPAEEEIDINTLLSFDSAVLGRVSFGQTPERRRQTLAMFSCSLYFIGPMVFGCWAASIGVMFLHRYAAAAMCVYFAYFLVLGLDKAAITGSRTPFLRNFRTWWYHACDYLPLLLVQTAEFDPSKKYVLGYHPHGIISVGAFCAFATDGAQTLSLVKKNKQMSDEKDAEQEKPRGFSSLFPGIDRRVVTLPQNFMTPFLREYFLAMGAVDSCKETFRNFLSSPGRALVVVVGGAAESMMVQPGTIDLILSKRRGFVREAIMAGACLVPVIGFGESNLYQVFATNPDHWMVTVQRACKKYVGIAMPLFRGRGVFLKDAGMMPMRTPVVVVVGAPIEPPTLGKDSKTFAPQVDRATDTALNKDGEILLEWHQKYMTALTTLHKTHEDASWNAPGKLRRKSLMIVK